MRKYWYILFSYQKQSGGISRMSRTLSINAPEFPLLATQKELIEKVCQDYSEGTFLFENWTELTQWQFQEIEGIAK